MQRGWVILAALIALWQALAVDAANQDTIVLRGDRLSGVVLPIEPLAGDLSLSALRASAWTVDDTKRLLLEGDVDVQLGGYRFQSPSAVVWINRIPSAAGEITQLAVFLERADDHTKRAGLGVQGDDVLVTASFRGETGLRVSSVEDRQPRGNDLVTRGEARLAQHLAGIVNEPQALGDMPRVEAPPLPEPFTPMPGGAVAEKDVAEPARIVLPPSTTDVPWLADSTGMVTYAAERLDYTPGEIEDIITATGSLSIEMVSRARGDAGRLTLTAQRAVIFAAPGSLKSAQGATLGRDAVKGIYLEGNVIATAPEQGYTVRAPRMYYDFTTNRAIMVNSVLRAQDREGRVPVYARAEELRQVADDQWQAQSMRVSTSEFAVPHVAIGAERVMVHRRARGEEAVGRDTYFDARDVTMRASGVPFAYVPRFAGTVDDVALKEVQAGSSKNQGFGIETTWDPFVLAGSSAPEGVSADLRIDGYFERGAGGGLVLDYDLGKSYGQVDFYGLYDTGEDRTTSGQDVQPDDEFRGVALWENTTMLSRWWTLQAQMSIISDPTFITSWREDDFVERREYETSLYLKRQEGRAALTLLAKYNVNEFLSNDYLIASRGYGVDKLPELTYRRYGDSFWDGQVNYSMENRLTHMRMAFQRRSPAETGIRPGAYNIDEDLDISQALKAGGLTSQYVNRFDTRHEITMPFEAGPINITPFLVARFTAYDDDFETFSSDADDMRFHGAAGVRFNTQFQRVFNGVQNRLLNLHRLRHIVEPSLTLWHGESNVDDGDLPEYDAGVESIGSGSAVRLGVLNTWQTQRGGPGNWRSVDVLKWDLAAVLDTSDTNIESPTSQWLDYRPEYSQFGDHLYTAAVWQVSDALAISGEATYSLEADELSRGSIGVELRHSPALVTYVEYRVIEVDDTELLGIGWTYELTRKYEISLTPQYDFNAEDFRAVTARVTRHFPDFDFIFRVRYDQIQDDTSVSASMSLAEF